MSPKLFAIFAILLLSFQGITGAGLKAQRNPKDLQQDAINAIEELKLILQAAIADAKAALQSIINDLQALAQSTINQGLADIQAEVDKVLAEIDALVQQAEQLGQNIEGCLGDQLTAVQQLPVKLGESLVKCVTDQVNEALNIVNTTIAEIEATWSIVSNLENQLAACNGGVLCMGSVIIEAGSAVANLPGQIAEQVAAVEDLIATIQTDLTLCATAAVTQAATDAGAILNNIVTCVNNLLGKQ